MRPTPTPALTLILAATLTVSGCMNLTPAYPTPAGAIPTAWPTAWPTGGIHTSSARTVSSVSAASAATSTSPDDATPATTPPTTATSPTADPTNATTSPETVAPTTAIDLPWQGFVRDQRLRAVIERALTSNRGLRRAIADIEKARAQYRVQWAAQLPTVNVAGSGSKSRSLTTGAGAITSSSYSLQAGLSAYEIDLFGRLRSLTAAAQETYLATAETARATHISLISETATAWFTLAADRSKLAIAVQTRENAGRTVDLTRRRLQVGVTSAVDVHQAETTYEQARVDAAALQTTIAQDRNALELLAGGPVADDLLPDALPTANDALTDVPAGLSSAILLLRPDVLSAEHTLKSANADIGAARAALFPTLSLTAQGGLASTALSSLISGGTTIWSLAPSLTLPIFDGGSRRAQVDQAYAEREGALATYESTLQTAFREVADALATRGTLQEQLAGELSLVTAAERSSTLAQARYQRGIDTFLNALDAQRTLYSAQTALVTLRLTELTNRVTLYRTLGGGLERGEAATAGPLADYFK